MDDSYASEVTKLAVAKVCVALGFKQIQNSALESLSDIVRHYIQTLAVSAHDHAEMGGRAVIGVQDIFQILDTTKPKKTNWKDLREFAFIDSRNLNNDAAAKWNQPFPFDVPNFPVANPSKPSVDTKLSNLDQTTPKDAFVPSHLPNYPPAHTYKRSSTVSKKRSIVEVSGEEGSRVRDGAQKAVKRVAAIKSAQQSLTMIEDSMDR